MEQPVTITFDVRHLPVLRRALDCYTRLRAGQIGIALDEVYADKRVRGDRPSEYDDPIERLVREGYFPELKHPGSSHGVGRYGYGGEEAYEISATLRQFLAYLRNDGFVGDGVDYYKSLAYSGVPMPVIHGFTTKKFFKAPDSIAEDLMKFYQAESGIECFDLIVKKWENPPSGQGMEVVIHDGAIGLLVTAPKRPNAPETTSDF